MPSQDSQLFAKLGESSHLYKYVELYVQHIYILYILLCNVVKSTFRSLLGNFSTIVGCICTSCFYDMFQEVLKPQNLYKFIKINHTWLNSFPPHVTPKKSLVTLHKEAWTLWRIFSPVRKPNFSFSLVVNLLSLKNTCCKGEILHNEKETHHFSLPAPSTHQKNITRYG